MTAESPNQCRCPKCDRPFQPGRANCMWCGAPLPSGAEAQQNFGCPNCEGVALEEQRGEGWVVYLCPQCEGVWMTTPMLQRFETLFEKIPALPARHDAAGDALSDSPGENAEGGADSARPGEPVRSLLDKAPSDAPLYRRCPNCRGQMARRRYRRISAIIVDECLGHGTWFDSGEFQSAVAFLKQGGLAREKADKGARAAAERSRMRRTLAFLDRISTLRGGLRLKGF